MQITDKSSRKISFFSFWCATLVMLQHCSCFYDCTKGVGAFYRILVRFGVCDIAVPFFFVVSGFFLMKHYDGTFKWWRKTVTQRLVTLGVPYLLWCAIGGAIVWYSWGAKDFNAFKFFGITAVTPFYGTLWYIKYLLIMVIVSPILIRIIDWFGKLRYGTVLLMIIGMVFLVVKYPCKSVISNSLVYFSLGVYAARCGIVDKPRRWLWIGISGAIALITLRLVLLHRGVELDALRSLQTPCVLVALWLSYDQLSDAIIKKFNNRFLRSIYSLSFVVYCCHTAIQFYLAGTNRGGQILQVIALWLAVVSLSVTLGSGCRRFVPTVYGVLTGGRGLKNENGP